MIFKNLTLVQNFSGKQNLCSACLVSGPCSCGSAPSDFLLKQPRIQGWSSLASTLFGSEAPVQEEQSKCYISSIQSIFFSNYKYQMKIYLHFDDQSLTLIFKNFTLATCKRFHFTMICTLQWLYSQRMNETNLTNVNFGKTLNDIILSQKR